MSMMKWTSTITALSLSVIGFSAMSAQDNNFQNELTVNYMDYSSNKFDKDPTWGVVYSYYGSPISQSSSPYQLNRFLAQTSVLDLNYSNRDSDNSYGIGGEYVFDSKWFIGANYERVETSPSGDADIYDVSIGYYANDFTKLYFSANRAESGNQVDGSESYQYDIGIRTFLETSYGEGFYITADLDFVDSEVRNKANKTNSDYRAWGVSVDYYFTDSFSVGGSYADASYDGAKDSYTVNAAYFVRLIDHVSLSLNATKALEPSTSGFFYDIGLVGRF